MNSINQMRASGSTDQERVRDNTNQTRDKRITTKAC